MYLINGKNIQSLCKKISRTEILSYTNSDNNKDIYILCACIYMYVYVSIYCNYPINYA